MKVLEFSFKVALANSLLPISLIQLLVVKDFIMVYYLLSKFFSLCKLDVCNAKNEKKHP